MSNIIDSIQVSGTVYQIQGSGGNPTVELTQAEYDALVSAGTVSPTTYYIITDATPIDVSNYYTKSETSGATQISTALNAKQDTLIAGDNITISGNVISASGGGSSVNVVQTTGSSTTDVMSQNVVTNAINTVSGNVITAYTNSYDGQGRTGVWAQAAGGKDNLSIFATKINNKDIISGGYSNRTRINVNLSLVEASAITSSVTSASTDSQVPSAKAVYDAMSSGGGITSGDVESMISAATSGYTERFAEDEEVTAAALNVLNNKFGGLKLVKLTQAEYTALTTKDPNTLYIITNIVV